MNTVKVTNFKTGKKLYFVSCSEFEAVRNAYAISIGDLDTKNYTKYNSLVEEGKAFWFCGDWAARKHTLSHKNTI